MYAFWLRLYIHFGLQSFILSSSNNHKMHRSFHLATVDCLRQYYNSNDFLHRRRRSRVGLHSRSYLQPLASSFYTPQFTFSSTPTPWETSSSSTLPSFFPFHPLLFSLFAQPFSSMRTRQLFVSTSSSTFTSFYLLRVASAFYPLGLFSTFLRWPFLLGSFSL